MAGGLLSHWTGPQEARDEADVRLRLLGGFQAEHALVVPESAWQQRRSAKTLIKVVACHPSHSLHREQILELLWPEMDFSSALNSFGKALHVARRALEPSMPSRGVSSYLRLVDEILYLVTDRIWIDADHFQRTAEEALRRGDPSSLEAAVALYTGELLPEDTYESWTTFRRSALSELHLRLLQTLADAFERRSQHDLAIEQLNKILQVDRAREDVHRRLMALHAAGGRRLVALRQYQLCCEALKQEVDAEPEHATVALHESIRDNTVAERSTGGTLTVPATSPVIPAPVPRQQPSTPLVGRHAVLHLLNEDLAAAHRGTGVTVFVSGPLGVGKSRLVEEVACDAAPNGALVLWGASLEAENQLPYAPFSQALEEFVASWDTGERDSLADRYPILTDVLPSLSAGRDRLAPVVSTGTQHGQLFSVIARVLTDLATRQTVMLVLEDLHRASEETLHLLSYLSRLANQRQLFIVCTFREEELPPDSKLREIVASGIRNNICHHVYLPLLSRPDSDTLVEVLLEDAPPSASLLDQVWDTSSGNPFLVTESICAMQQRDELILKHGQWRVVDQTSPQIPQQVRKLVDTYLGQIDERSGRVLALIALAGPDVTFRELLLASNEAIDPDITDTGLLDIVESAMRRGVIAERGPGYSFAYPLFGVALGRGLSRQRQIHFHAAIAHAVEQCRPGDVELLAYHYARNEDLERGAVYLQRATDRARVGGLAEAEEAHLWKLLERLHLLRRTEDAEQVRTTLRSLILEAGPISEVRTGELQQGAG